MSVLTSGVNYSYNGHRVVGEAIDNPIRETPREAPTSTQAAVA